VEDQRWAENNTDQPSAVKAEAGEAGSDEREASHRDDGANRSRR
jgi:hypothetical protein